jgi:hypothetical protein
MTGQTDPEALLNGVREKLQTQWQQHRKQSFNNNTKGAAYEKALRGFLLEYFEGIYKIQTRTAVIDQYLECFEVFSSGQSELDVVATFRQAVPGIVFQSGDMKWVPYDAVSFICEVKSELTKPSLVDDIEKLEKVNSLDIKETRFDRDSGRSKLTKWDSGDTIVRDLSVDHPLRCLVYDEESISAEFLLEYAASKSDQWDLILLVDEDVILVSPNLPFAEGWYDNAKVDNEEFDIKELLPETVVLSDGLIWFIILLSVSIPRPKPFDTTPALLGLVQGEWEGAPDSSNNMFEGIFQLLSQSAINNDL